MNISRLVCGWTDKLPADCRDAADEILVTAARAGACQEDLAVLDGRDDQKRAELIAERLQHWKSMTNA